MNDIYTLGLNDMRTKAEDTIKKTRNDIAGLDKLAGEVLNGITEGDIKSDMSRCILCSLICAVYSIFLFTTGYYPIAGLCCLILSPLAGLHMYFRFKKASEGYKDIFEARRYLNSAAESLERQLSAMDGSLRQYSMSDTAGYRVKISEGESLFTRLPAIETTFSQFKSMGSPYSTDSGKNLVILSAAAVSVAGALSYLPQVCELFDTIIYDLSDSHLEEWSMILSIAAVVGTLIVVYFGFKKLWSKYNCRVTGTLIMYIPFTVLLFPVILFCVTVIAVLGAIAIAAIMFIGSLAIASACFGLSGG